MDQPKQLLTSDKFIIELDDYTVQESYFYVYNPSTLVAGQGAVPTIVGASPPQATPAVQNTATSNAYFVTNPCSGAGFTSCGLTLITVSGGPTSPTVTTNPNITGVNPVPEPASGWDVPAGGSCSAPCRLDNRIGQRILGVVYEVETSDSQSVIVFTGMEGCQAPYNTSNICSYVVRMTPSLAILGKRQYGQVGYSALYPSLSLDATGRPYVTYSRTSSSAPPSAYITGGSSSGAGGAPTFTTLLSAATGSGCPTQCRWGDYFGSVQDPAFTNQVWFETDYQNGPSLLYSTVYGAAASTGVL
jgi:hypothetical protein